MDLHEQSHLVRSRKDLATSVVALRADLDENRGRWQNTTLESFLSAMESWIVDMDGYYKNSGQPLADPPTWKTFADILMGARVYE